MLIKLAMAGYQAKCEHCPAAPITLLPSRWCTHDESSKVGTYVVLGVFRKQSRSTPCSSWSKPVRCILRSAKVCHSQRSRMITSLAAVRCDRHCEFAPTIWVHMDRSSLFVFQMMRHHSKYLWRKRCRMQSMGKSLLTPQQLNKQPASGMLLPTLNLAPPTNNLTSLLACKY